MVPWRHLARNDRCDKTLLLQEAPATSLEDGLLPEISVKEGCNFEQEEMKKKGKENVAIQGNWALEFLGVSLDS